MRSNPSPRTPRGDMRRLYEHASTLPFTPEFSSPLGDMAAIMLEAAQVRRFTHANPDGAQDVYLTVSTDDLEGRDARRALTTSVQFKNGLLVEVSETRIYLQDRKRSEKRLLPKRRHDNVARYLLRRLVE